MATTKTVAELKRGDVVTRVPYFEVSDGLPVTVEFVHSARRKNSRILEGLNAKGVRVLIPVGHFSNVVEVR